MQSNKKKGKLKVTEEMELMVEHAKRELYTAKLPPRRAIKPLSLATLSAAIDFESTLIIIHIILSHLMLWLFLCV